MNTLTIKYASALPSEADVVVVGSGILGAATAFFAAKAGLRCVVLEKHKRICSLTTPAATGAYRLQFDNAEEMAMVRKSVDFFSHFSEAAGLPFDYDIGMRPQGYLWLTRSEAGVERHRKLVADQHSWGLTDVELMGQTEVERRFPYLVKGEILSARFRNGDGFIDQKRLTMGLAAGSGATFVTECEATGFVQAGGRVTGVITTQGTISADAVVLAAGPFTGNVAQWVGLNLPIAPTVRQKLVLPVVPEVPQWAPMTIDDDTGAHWRPALQGAYLIYTDPTTPETAPADPVPTDPTYYETMLDPASPFNVGQLSPFWNEVWERNDDHWFIAAGQYDYTPDRRPLLGPSGVEGLYLNVGYSGHGVMASVGGSELVIGTLLGTVAQADNPFRADREMVAQKKDVI
jgi:sarcosine oxidase subunit beta